MKNVNFLLISSFLLLVVSCKKNTQNVSIYKNHTVDFFTTHPDFEIIHPVFKTVEETFLETPAYLEGATFETIYEQVLVKEGYNNYGIMDSILVQITINEETDNTTELVCYHFFDSSDFTTSQVPSEYMTITSQRIIQQGTGAEVPATYSTFTKIILDTPPQLIPSTGERSFESVTFTIPEKRTIRGHLNYYFERQNIGNCKEGNSYRLND